jgi:hypothetical protein
MISAPMYWHQLIAREGIGHEMGKGIGADRDGPDFHSLEGKSAR